MITIFDQFTFVHWAALFLVGCGSLMAFGTLARLFGLPRLFESEEMCSSERLRNGIVLLAYIGVAYLFLQMAASVCFWADSGRAIAISGIALFGFCQLPIFISVFVASFLAFEAMRRRIFME